MNNLGAVEWSALSAAIVLLISIIGVVVRLLDRISKADAKAEAADKTAQAAAISIAANHLEIERLKADLVDHRVAVAKEYVSKDTLVSLENRVIDAINSLGQRLDSLFKGTR